MPNALCFGRELPATGLPCHLEVLPTELSIQSPESTVETIPLHRLAVKSGGFDQDHLVLSWTDDGQERQVYVRDSAVIHALRASEHTGAQNQVLRSLEHVARAKYVTKLWGWFAIVSAIALFAGLWVTSGVLVRTAVNRIPIEWEHSLGKSARQELLAGQRVVTEGPAVRAVEDITRRLTEQLPNNPYPFDITVVRNEAVNAMALPGGFVIVYTGLLKQADSPDEVAGVLAHELNHVLLRHGLEGIVQSLGITALVMVFLGNQQGLIGALERLGVHITTLKFSREKEAEADLQGLRLLHRAHVSPAGMIRFFERLANTGGAPIALLSTHPMSAERAVRLKSEALSLPNPSPSPFEIDWPSVKASL